MFLQGVMSLIVSKIIDVSVNKKNSQHFHIHTVGNDGINASFMFPYICSLILYFYPVILVNVKLDVSGYRIDYISRLQTSLVKLILNGTAKTKLEILAFLYSGEIMKN